MSVTFWCPQAPSRTELVPCDYPGCDEGNRCGYCRDGFDNVRISEGPEVNVTGGNALNILRLLGQTAEEWGGWKVEEMPAVRRAILLAKAQDKDREALVREASESQGTKIGKNDQGVTEIQRTCKVIDFGNTDEQTLRRLDNLEALLVYAQANQMEINWG